MNIDLLLLSLAILIVIVFIYILFYQKKTGKSNLKEDLNFTTESKEVEIKN